MQKKRRDPWGWTGVVILLIVGITLGCSEKTKEVGAATSTSTDWNISKALLSEGYIYDIVPLGKENLWAGGAFGKIFHYNGKEWQPSPVPGSSKDFHLFDLDFPAPDNGWAVGEDMVIPKKQGVMLHYDGKRWSTVDNPSNDSLLSIHFTSPENGWAVGSTSNILHFNGTTWEKVQAPRFCYLSRVFFAAPDNGWAVGNEGVILRYDGTAWSVAQSPTKEHLYGLHFPTPQEGWAVGDMGTILRYQGGAWTMVPSPTDLTLFAVYFKSPQEGYAVGAAGTVLRYQGGKWEAMKDSPTPKFLYTVAWENPLGLLVAGREKMIFNNPKVKE